MSSPLVAGALVWVAVIPIVKVAGSMCAQGLTTERLHYTDFEVKYDISSLLLAMIIHVHVNWKTYQIEYSKRGD